MLLCNLVSDQGALAFVVSGCVSRCLAVWPLSTSSCHGITPRLSNFHHQLTACFHWFMSRLPPAHIQGLFARLDYMIDIHAWHELLPINASSCKLMRLQVYKTKVATFPKGKFWRPSTSLETTANTISLMAPQQSLTRVPSHLGLLP